MIKHEKMTNKEGFLKGMSSRKEPKKDFGDRLFVIERSLLSRRRKRKRKKRREAEGRKTKRRKERKKAKKDVWIKCFCLLAFLLPDLSPKMTPQNLENKFFVFCLLVCLLVLRQQSPKQKKAQRM